MPINMFTETKDKAWLKWNNQDLIFWSCLDTDWGKSSIIS
jgi:hypothetical protein